MSLSLKLWASPPPGEAKAGPPQSPNTSPHHQGSEMSRRCRDSEGCSGWGCLCNPSPTFREFKTNRARVSPLGRLEARPALWCCLCLGNPY